MWANITVGVVPRLLKMKPLTEERGRTPEEGESPPHTHPPARGGDGGKGRSDPGT